MTEGEWLNDTHPTPMLEYLEDRGNQRKKRLFSCACCRRAWHLIHDERLRHAIDMVELAIDDAVTMDKRKAAGKAANLAYEELPNPSHSPEGEAGFGVYLTVNYPHNSLGVARAIENALNSMDECRWQAKALHDIFGNPFRPIHLNPSWLTSTVHCLVSGIYSEKAFDRMPILADALQDAGCDNAEVLNHCRQPGEHVRGCWVVDLLMGTQ